MSLEWSSWGHFAVSLLIGAVITVLLGVIYGVVVRIIERRHQGFAERYSAPVKQLRILTAAIALQIVIAISWPSDAWRSLAMHIALILIVMAAAWLLSAALSMAIRHIRAKHPVTGDDDQEARRIQTQLSMIRTFLTAAIWLVAGGIALSTIPGAQAAGTSLLASAGLVSVVVGVAAQSVLGNVFAGLQLAFNGLVRVGDMVTVQAQGQQKTGRIDQITLTAVVIKEGDERQLVMPSSAFTTQPYENWTRGNAQLLGTVDLDVDWRVDPAKLREQLQTILDGHELWDKRQGSLTVQDAVDGVIRVQAQVSAANPADLGQLKLDVRERLVAWIATQEPNAIPVQRNLNEGIAGNVA